MSIDEFEQEYLDLAGDVEMASYQTYEQKLLDWFDFLDGTPQTAARVATLESDVDFENWYSSAKLTVSSMVGSGSLDWARDRTQRLGQLLALFRHIANTPDAYIDFSSNFMWAGNGFDEMIYKINRELFESFARELLKDLKRNFATQASAQTVPASDRIVPINHNSEPFSELTDKLAALEVELDQSNTLTGEHPENADRVKAEISAGARLFQATKIRAVAAWSLLYPALKWLADHFAAGIIGVLATALIALLASALGVPIPGI